MRHIVFVLQLMRAHSERRQIIKRCITEVSDIVSTLRKQHESAADDPQITMKLRSERNKVSVFQCLKCDRIRVFY